jgi:hypothetical protein
MYYLIYIYTFQLFIGYTALLRIFKIITKRTIIILRAYSSGLAYTPHDLCCDGGERVYRAAFEWFFFTHFDEHGETGILQY